MSMAPLWAAPIVGEITRLVLYNADTDQVITAFDPLLTGHVIDTSIYGANLNVVAEVSGIVGSVVFDLDGVAPYRTESVAPYALNGDNNGNFAVWAPAPGSHTIVATPYAGGGGTGDQGASLAVTFEVVTGGGDPPPNAVIITDVTAGVAPLTVNFDGAGSTGDIFSWDFGDGSTASTVSPTHTYVTAGTYVVQLTVEDTAGLQDAASVTISVSEPGGNGAFIESGGLVSIEAESFFSNVPVGVDAWVEKSSSSSTNSAPSGYSGSLAMYAADDASNSNYSPGAGPEMTYEVTFTTAGTYYLWTRVWADDHNANRLHGGLEGNWQVGQETKASYIVEWTYDSWQWTNERATGGEIAYVYVATPGTYTINIWLQKDGLFFDKLLLSNDAGYIPSGLGPAESPRDGTVNIPPAADFTASEGGTPYEFVFDASLSSDPDGTIISYDWDFGDGSADTGQTATHTYAAVGTYSVQLTVLDDEGATGQITKDVVVSEEGGTGAFLEQGGLLSMEAEHAQRTGASGTTWSEVTDKAGFSGTAALQALPNTGTLINTGYAASSPEMTFDVQLSQGGRYWVWVRMWAANDLDNSVHAGYNGAETGSAAAMEQTVYNSWQWTRNRKYATEDAYIDTESGLHTVSVWMREDGVYIDKVVLTTDENYVPTGVGPVESPRDDGSGENQSPVASFTSTIDGLTVDFISTSTDPDGDIDSWVWDFGDGGTATTEVVTHTYVAAGSYTVTLTVQDMEGASGSTQQTVTVTDGTNLPPVISVTVDPGKTVGNGSTVTFDAGATVDPDGDLMTFQWFDEGNQLLGNGDLYIHTTAASGTSEVIRLEVSDGQLTSEEIITLTLTEESKRLYYVKDHLGSIRAVVNESGTVVSYSDYYPFGLVLRGEQSELTQENYTGHELDTETGLLYAGARYYMPEIGRWGSVDPLADVQITNGTYNYAYNNPLSYLDATGLIPCQEIYGNDAPAGECLNEGEVEVTAFRDGYKVDGFTKFLIEWLGYEPFRSKGHGGPKTELEQDNTGQWWAIPSEYNYVGPSASPIDVLLMPGAVIGYSSGLSRTALQGMRGGGGHAIRHLQKSGLISNSGSLTIRVAKFEKIAVPILEHPLHTFNWKLGATQARGFLGLHNGQHVAIFVAKEGAYQGKVLSAIVPNAKQLATMLSK